MSWKKITLEDICISIADGDHQPPPKSDNGIPFVTISNITNTNKLDFTDTMFVSQEYYDNLNDKRRAHTGDILYSVVGSFGIPVFIDKEQKFVFQRHIAILRPDPKKIVPRFLYYMMLSRDFYMKVDTVALGAAQRTISLTALRKMEIEIPPYNTQEKIVKILKPFDNLIENNQKQIKLLEEAAQCLYKEWFVDLRFPGYEKVKVIDGVPEGWTKDILSNVAILKAGGDKPKVFSKKCDSKYVVPVYSNGTEHEGLYGYTDVAAIKEACVTISARGSVGYTCLRRIPFVPIVRLISVIPKELDVIYLYLYLNNFKFDSNGAAQQQITVPMIKEKQVLIPAKDILDKFIQLIYPIQNAIDKRKNQIEKLIEASDRLLPKLMSSELEV